LLQAGRSYHPLICLLFLLHNLYVHALEWDGLEGSFGIFGLRASLVGMPNVPESEGTVRVGFLMM